MKMKYSGFMSKLFHTFHPMIEKLIGDLLSAGKMKELNYQSHNFSPIHSQISNNSCF